MSKKNKYIKAQKRAEKRQAKKAERENEKFQKEIENNHRDNIAPIPYIIGANFNFDNNDINGIEEKISSLPRLEHKIKVLFISEASYLRTGFSTYMREVLKRLHATNKFELAELGSYGNSPDIDPRAKNIPWRYFHNMPSNNIEDAEYKKDYKENQFGKWKLSYSLAEFKPDIVIDIRDNWMIRYELSSPFRDYFLLYWMPTVDGYPQKWEWLQDYSKADKIYTYSYFGKRVLEEQSRTKLAKRIRLPEINVSNVMQPGVDINTFKPLDKKETKEIFGVPEHLRFIGTVMRNQPRKLFTRIIESFRIFKQKYPIQSKDVLLLLHTSIPDVGWDIPECVRQNDLEEFVVYSYMCQSCGLLAVSTFVGSPTTCPKCGKNTFHTPNTQIGYQEQNFNYIFNLMDVYVQGSIAEGDGMPPNEAKCCGVPVICSDFSALYEKNRNGGGMPIINETIYTEHETMQWRSLFDREDLAEKLAILMGNEEKRRQLSNEARQCAIKYYNWDLCAKKWEYELLTAKIKDRKNTWEKPIDIKIMNKSSPPIVVDNKEGYKEWLTWCYINILGRKGIDPDGLQHWTRVLENSKDKNKTKDELEKHFRKIIETENESKNILANPQLAITDPVQKIKTLIEEMEKIEK